MFGYTIEKFLKSLPPIFLISFMWIAIFGFGMNMDMNDMGKMSDCPFVAQRNAICQMSVTEHITQWQQMFLSVPTKGDTLALAIILLVIITVPFSKPFSELEKLTEFVTRLFANHKARIVKVSNPLLIAFSDGILNPKIY